MPTYPIAIPEKSVDHIPMFLRSRKRMKNGKEHRYFSVVENRRLPGGKTMQRQVLHLGEINDRQEAAWRKALQVFEEDKNQSETYTLFPDDRPIPSDVANGLQLKITELQLLRPRSFGDCWLACWLWNYLKLDNFWQAKLSEHKGEIPWAKVLQLLVVNRLIAPGSEFRLHRHWYYQSAMDVLLDTNDGIASKDRLYRCLDKILAHRDDFFKHLKQRWEDLFSTTFDVLLYDLTSTYFEGQCEAIPKAKHGYSRDRRSDCRQVVIALVITPDGLPLAYEVLPGNTSDKTTLRDFLNLIENKYGKARRTWVMDRGIPTEEVLKEMRANDVGYLVGTPRGRLSKLEQRFLDLPWESVHDDVAVKMDRVDNDVYVLARSNSRVLKERAIRRRKLRNLFNGLRKLKRRAMDGKIKRDQLLERIGALKSDAGRAASFVKIEVPKDEENLKTFSYRLREQKFKEAQMRDGHYLLRTNIEGEDPRVLWQRYIQLTQIEGAFKTLKSDLSVRPVYHFVEQRVEAHIFIAFMAYALSATLRKRLDLLAPGLTTPSVLDTLSSIQMIDVEIPVTDGRVLKLQRHTQPEQDASLLLERLNLQLPEQPPPRITNPSLWCRP